MRVAFGYKARCGKDTACDYLLSTHGGFQKLSFAALLYDAAEAVQRMFGFQVEKDRKLLQWLGTEYARAKDPDVFVKEMMRRLDDVDKLKQDGYSPNILVSDLRFPNEFQALRSRGFFLIKVERQCESQPGESHSSETLLDSLPEEEWDAVVQNNGTLEEYYEKLDKLWDELELQHAPSHTRVLSQPK